MSVSDCLCCKDVKRRHLELVSPMGDTPTMPPIASELQFDAHDLVEIAVEAARLALEWTTPKAAAA